VACETTYVFNVFLRFFQNPKNMTFYVFLSGWPRFLEHWPWSRKRDIISKSLNFGGGDFQWTGST